MKHVPFIYSIIALGIASDPCKQQPKASADDQTNFYDRCVVEYENAEQLHTNFVSNSILSSSNNYLNNDENITLGLIRRIGRIPQLVGLDCGCGPYATDMKIFMSFNYSMYAFDASQETINRNIANNDALNQENMKHIVLPSVFPYNESQFDFVHIRAVIQHLSSWDDVTHVLKEIYRVLRRGGILSLIFKHGAHESNLTIFDRNYAQYRVFTLYDVGIMLSYLNSLGFRLINKSVKDGLGGIMYYTNRQPVSHCILWLIKDGYNLLVLYNLAIDINIDFDTDTYVGQSEPGGGLYSACMASFLGLNTHLISKNAAQHSYLFNITQGLNNGIRIRQISTNRSTHCKNIFIRNKRFTFIPDTAPVYTTKEVERYLIKNEDLSEINMVLLGGLHSQELGFEYYDIIAQKFNDSIIICDGQSLFRNIQNDTSVKTVFDALDSYLSNNGSFVEIDLLKIGLSELIDAADNGFVDSDGTYMDIERDLTKDWIRNAVKLLFSKWSLFRDRFVKSVLITTPKYMVYCTNEANNEDCYFERFRNALGKKQNGRGDVALTTFGAYHYLYKRDVGQSLKATKYFTEYAAQDTGPVCTRLYV